MDLEKNNLRTSAMFLGCEEINFDFPCSDFYENKLPRSRADEVLTEKHFSFEAELRGI